MRTDPPCVGLGGVNEYLRSPKVYEEEGRGREKRGKKGKRKGNWTGRRGRNVKVGRGTVLSWGS